MSAHLAAVLMAVLTGQAQVPPPALAALNMVSGYSQTTPAATVFPEPLTVITVGWDVRPLPGIPVWFRVESGDAQLSAAMLLSDAQGRASVRVTAGKQDGPVTVSASAGHLTAYFEDVVTGPVTPVIAAEDFQNAASLEPGIAPCGLVLVEGRNLVPGPEWGTRDSVRLPSGEYPLSLDPVDSVHFGDLPAPIFTVESLRVFGKPDRMVVQAPCDLAPGVTSATITVRGHAATVHAIPVSEAHPGIHLREDDVAHVVLADGSIVTPDNLPQPGDRIYFRATGLGRNLTPIVVSVNGVDAAAAKATASEWPGRYDIEATVAPGTAPSDRVPLTVSALGHVSRTAYTSVGPEKEKAATGKAAASQSSKR